MGGKLNLGCGQILAQYLRTGQETYLYQVAQFGKTMMDQGIGPESIVEMHLQAVKKINKNEKEYPRQVIDESFNFLMEGIMAYREYLSSKTDGYLAEIRELNRRLSQRLAEMTALHETVKVTGSSLDLDEVLSTLTLNLSPKGERELN